MVISTQCRQRGFTFAAFRVAACAAALAGARAAAVVATRTVPLAAALAVAVIAGACNSDIAEPSGARLDVTSETVELGTNDIVTTVLRNPGGRPLEWQIQGAPGWLNVSPASGTLEPGGEQPVQLSADRAVAPLGSTLVELTVQGNVFHGPGHFAVRVEVPPSPELEVVSVSAVTYPNQSAVITVRNAGRGTLQYSLQTDASWLEFSGSGAVAEKGTYEIPIAVDRTYVPRDTIVHVVITTNGTGGPVQVPIAIAGNPAPVHLAAGVTFARFRHGQLIYSAGDRTYLLDWMSGERQSLTGVPAVIDVAWQPVTDNLAVAHGSRVSVFPAGTLAPAHSVETGVPLAGIAFAGNGLLFAIPEAAAAGLVLQVDPAAGTVSEHHLPLPVLRRIQPPGASPGVGNGIYVTTSDGIYLLNVDQAYAGGPVTVRADRGGTGLRFNAEDGRTWMPLSRGITSGGVMFQDTEQGLALLGELREHDGTLVERVESAAMVSHANAIAVVGAIGGGPWRLYTGPLWSDDYRFDTVPLGTVTWAGQDSNTHPRLVQWRDGEVVVLEEGIAGTAAGEWFVRRLWRW